MELSRLLGSRAHDAAARMAQFAASFGVTGMKHPPRIPNTRRALAIAELAREKGVLDAFRRSAMEAHWREEKDLELDTDLGLIAGRAGLDRGEAVSASRDPRYLARIDAVRAEANELGFTGIPTFVFGELEDSPSAVVGCQPYETLARAAERAGATPRARE
jgi:predicted DsbA family dithiol-disulfide isomerase